MNILNILKDKPKGTKLYSPICGECTLENIYPITVLDSNKSQLKFYNDGVYSNNGECLLFPSREMRDWNKYLWKKGDVLTNGDEYCIFDHFPNDKYNTFIGKFVSNTLYNTKITLITEDWVKVEYQNSIDHYISSIEHKYNGKLNLETLEIEKEEKKEYEFKDGDIVVITACYGNNVVAIFKNLQMNRLNCYAYLSCDLHIEDWINIEEKELRLATDSEKQQLFDALAKEGKVWDAEKKLLIDLSKEHVFKPFERVLVRDRNDERWRVEIFRFFDLESDYPYKCMNTHYVMCIPYEGNEHLCNTANNPE